MKSSTETLINALRVLVRDIQSDDGVANAAISEAADRLQEQQERIKRLETVGDALEYDALEETEYESERIKNASREWRKAKGARP